MENSIVLKLREELGLKLEREPQALYILAEIRKLIEHRKDQGLAGHRDLNLYCNWALHIKIDRDNDNVTTIFDGVDILEGVSFDDYVRSSFFNYISNFHLMRTALGSFLEEYRLPKDLVDRDDRWNEFLFLFCGVVSEVPLVYRGTPKNPQTIRELVLSREREEPSEAFRLTWKATLFSGEEHRIVTDCPQAVVEYDWLVRNSAGLG